MFEKEILDELSLGYVNCVKDKELKISNKLRLDFLGLLKSDLESRHKKWEEIKKEHLKSELKKLANPFFIGYGNPNANILFLGKEKAFQIDNPNRLYLKESINNILQWKNIVNGTKQNELDFNPVFPRKAFPNLKRSHTWAKYATLLQGIIDNSKVSFDELIHIENSFFSKCFLTELNYKPSPKGKSIRKIRNDIFFKKRENFLCKIIIPKFDTIIIGAWSYFSNQDSNQLKIELTALFGEVEECKEMSYWDRKILPFLHYRTIEGNKNIYLTYQLSGSAGWSNSGLKNFAKRIKADLKK
ncbi:MAG: hypothetical protein AB8G86_00555 [Saprospiraceae bacterium]